MFFVTECTLLNQYKKNQKCYLLPGINCKIIIKLKEHVTQLLPGIQCEIIIKLKQQERD